MTFCPAHSVVQHPKTQATHTAYVLHGILGHQRNWRSFARAFTQQHPSWRFVLIDLRNHGASHGAPGPHTVQTAAQDLLELIPKVGRPDAIIGHSFGGKVALAFSTLLELSQTWVLDAIPTPQTESAKAELRDIFSRLKAAGAPFSSREDMVQRLTDQGLAVPLIQWMTTNLKRVDAEYHWAFQLANACDMIESYFVLDGRTVLEQTTSPIHIVRAANSPRWTADIVDELNQINPCVQVHRLENAGHWVHVDNPVGLQALLSPYFN